MASPTRRRSPPWIEESMRVAIIREPSPATSIVTETASGVTKRVSP
jgi:hypothetical protein